MQIQTFVDHSGMLSFVGVELWILLQIAALGMENSIELNSHAYSGRQQRLL